ncbi:MAG: hypothetical protein HKN89_03390 [Eudoraea sp.]|nr:hypothetical protein [Eudoraea sp.]
MSLIAYKGGVASNMIDNSGECRKYPGLFFSGTILNDQVTHIKGENKSVAEGIQELAKKVVG